MSGDVKSRSKPDQLEEAFDSAKPVQTSEEEGEQFQMPDPWAKRRILPVAANDDVEDLAAQNRSEEMLTALRSLDAETAHRLADEALAADPENTQAMIDKALAYSIQGNIEKSMEYNRMALEIDPDNGVALHNLGCDYLDQGEPQKALECFLEAMEKGEKDGLTYACLAQTYEELGDKEKALEYYEKALTSPPVAGIFVDNSQLLAAEYLGFSSVEDALEYIRNERSGMKATPTTTNLEADAA